MDENSSYFLSREIIRNYVFGCNIPCNLGFVGYNRGMQNGNDNVPSIWFSAYGISDRFLKTIVEKHGKEDLFFRDVYNYRNLEKDGISDLLSPFCSLPLSYEDFPKRTVDYYVSAIGKDRFRKCLDDPRLNIETLFDEKDFFIDCRDVLDFWLMKDGIVTAKEDFHAYDFEHCLMEELNDRFSNPDDPSLESGKLFYVFREKTESLESC